MNFDSGLVDDLRRLAAAGESPCALAGIVLHRLKLDAGGGRLHVIAYFQEAFLLALQDAMRIGAAPIFPGESRATSDIDAELLPLLEATRDLWQAR
jgi:hypothetical protein